MVMNKLYVVVTCSEVNDEINDVVLITDDEQKAKDTVTKLEKVQPIEGLDYLNLTEYEHASYFTRELNTINFGG
jgi:Tfp pilus assembly protein PilP